jgi:hypothetical protein
MMKKPEMEKKCRKNAEKMQKKCRKNLKQSRNGEETQKNLKWRRDEEMKKSRNNEERRERAQTRRHTVPLTSQLTLFWEFSYYYQSSIHFPNINSRDNTAREGGA